MVFSFVFDESTPSFWVRYRKRRGPFPVIKTVLEEVDLEDIYLELSQRRDVIYAPLCRSYLDVLPWFLVTYVFDYFGLTPEDIWRTHLAFRAPYLEFLRHRVLDIEVPIGISNTLYGMFLVLRFLLF